MSAKKKLLSNVIVIAALELLIMYLGMFVQTILQLLAVLCFRSYTGMDSEFFETWTHYASFIVPILLFLVFMRLTNREALKIFSMGTAEKRVRNVFLGLIAGTLVNSFLCVIVWTSGSVKLTFTGFSWRFLIVLASVFIQATAEEVALRGFLTSYLEGTHRWYAIALTGGMLFIFHHVANMMAYGFSVVFCLNVFLIGIALYLMMKLTRSFWICCGFHTGWNFTQEFVFGLPNSGNSSGLAILRGSEETKSFFFDPVYGNEGCLFCTVMCIILIFFLLLRFKKRSADGRNLLEETMLTGGL